MGQDVPNTPSFNLVQCSISKLLTNDYYDVLSKYFNLEIDRTVRVKKLKLILTPTQPQDWLG